MSIDDPTIITIIISIITAVAGILGGSFWTSRGKLKQFNLEVVQEQRKAYYRNAKKH